jgi:primosomal protein N' (replication factor Y)
LDTNTMTTSQAIQPELFTPLPSAPPQNGGLFAQIVFDRPLDHAYTYRVPDTLRDDVAIGKRIQAPFGRGDRATVGYCIGLTETTPDRPTKDLLQVVDEEPLFTDNLLRLTRWMADYYICGWGQVLNGVVPFGAKAQAGTRSVAFLEAIEESDLPDPPPRLTVKQTAALAMLRQQGKPLEPRALARLAGCGPTLLDALVQKGMVRKVQRRVETIAAEAVTEAHGESQVLVEEAVTDPLQLNADQERVWEPLRTAVQTHGFRPFLLFGVTGSGKTELYLRAIEEVVRQGKQALVLVPEISLTPQTIQRFQGRCGEVAVLHSHLRDAERGNQWRRIRSGQVQVIVGARSAVFAPADRLGLIVVDEEHEASFKQESTPRYNGRDVAVMRARLEELPIILGSATPSLESWHNAQRSQYTLLSLPNRVLDRKLPQVALIDLRHELPRSGPPQGLSPGLEHAMHRALRDDGQVILLLNRRGFSTHVHCLACGYVDTCRFCDLALTYHQKRDVNLCHYCGFEQVPPQLCPQCGRVHLRYQGLGTEKLEAEIKKKFSGYVIERMDSDTMKRPGSHGRLLSAFRRGEVHILMGTQMIAKGLDFPNVTLVGVVNADIGLHLPDFRAAERTFQLLSQVAGRAGRGQRDGQVIIQTFNPDHPAIALATAHDYLTFAEGELAHRREHKYPPYQRLVRVVVRSRKQEEAEQFAEQLAKAIEAALKKVKLAVFGQPLDLRVLGPAEAPVFRLKGYYRFHLQLQASSPGVLHQVLREVIHTVRAPSSVEFTLDVDPLNML